MHQLQLNIMMPESIQQTYSPVHAEDRARTYTNELPDIDTTPTP